MKPMTYRVKRIARDLHGTFALDLHPVKRSAGLAFVPGHFNMLYQFGAGEVPIKGLAGGDGR